MKQRETPSPSASTLRTGVTARKKPDRETLRTLYLVDKIGPKNIGLIYDVDKTLVNTWLIEEEIPRFGMKESAKIRVDRSLAIGGLGIDIKDETEEPYYCFSHADLRSLAEQGRITKLW
jgi:phosphatidate phosphatase APP1